MGRAILERSKSKRKVQSRMESEMLFTYDISSDEESEESDNFVSSEFYKKFKQSWTFN